MTTFGITALCLGGILLPLVVGTLIVIRQDLAAERRDNRWLSRHR